MLCELALFAGAGGSIWAGKLAGWEPVCAVENEPYCQAVLLARQADGSFPRFPIWDDVCTFDGTAWRGQVDIVTAGWPCQPWSTAGRRRGETDERNLWPEVSRILSEVRPRFALLENSPALLAHPYFGRIFGDLAEVGMDARWCTLSAAECGAWHRRDRLWIVANATGDVQGLGRRIEFESGVHRAERANLAGGGRDAFQQEGRQRITEAHGCDSVASDPDAPGFAEPQRSGAAAESSRRSEPSFDDWWNVEPNLVRVVHGLAFRGHRVGALGNGWCPIVAARAWQMLTCDSESR